MFVRSLFLVATLASAVISRPILDTAAGAIVPLSDPQCSPATVTVTVTIPGPEPTPPGHSTPPPPPPPQTTPCPSNPPKPPTPQPSGTPPGSGDQCNTGPVQCCNTVQNAGGSEASRLLGLLGVEVKDVNVPIGITCTPINVLGVGGNSCSAQTVCCQNNNFSGVIAIGCTPINISL